MNDTDARKLLVQAIRYANIKGLPGDLRDAFLAGTADIDLSRLDMDSLAAMELCIAIEANSLVSITPEQLRVAATGNALVALIVGRDL